MPHALHTAYLCSLQWRSIDVLPARAGKGSAAEYVRQKLGMEHANTVVAGDSGNDIGMLLMPGAAWHVSCTAPGEEVSCCG